MKTFRGSCSWWLAAWLAGWVGVAAAEAEPQWPALKGAAVELHAQRLAWQASATAATATLDVYLAAPAVPDLLREFELSVDAQASQRYQFSEQEAQGLREDQRQRLRLGALPPGPHQLRLHLIARQPGSKSRMPSIDQVLEQTVSLDAGSNVFELQLMPGSTFGKAQLQLRALSDPGSRADAAARYVALLNISGRSFAAASELRLLQLQAPEAALPASFSALAAASSDQLGLKADSSEQSATPVEQALLARYNQLIQSLAAGDAGAEQALDRIGQEPVQSPLAWALRDQANLSLAYELLRQHRSQAAIAPLERIRSPGLCDNAALLALGWAYLLPDVPADAGASPPPALSLRPADADSLAQIRRLSPFRYRQAVASGTRAEDIRRALVPWEELIGRDALDPAVQEGMLALPYALDHFGAHEQALMYYQRAVSQLQGVQSQLQLAETQLQNGALLQGLDARDAQTDSGWPRLLVAMRDDGEAVPLRRLRRDPAVAQSLQAHRESAALRQALAEDASALHDSSDPRASELAAQIEQLRTRLDALAAGQDAALRSAARAQLQSLRRQTDAYLAEAHFAVARAHDLLPGAPSYGASP